MILSSGSLNIAFIDHTFTVKSRHLIMPKITFKICRDFLGKSSVSHALLNDESQFMDTGND